MANVKISDLTAASGVTGDDLFEIENDPAGTPASQKATGTQLKSFVLGDGYFDLTDDTPGTPSANTVRIGRFLRGPWEDFQVVEENGLTLPRAPMAWSRVCSVIPQSNESAINAHGGNAQTQGGSTLTSRTVATTNLYTSAQRVGYVSAGTSGSSAGMRITGCVFWPGGGANQGGYRATWVFGVSDPTSVVAGGRVSVGVGAFPGNVDPSTLTNVIICACDASDTNLWVMHNDGSGACTEIDLGANFPVNNAINTDIYAFTLLCLPNSTSVQYSVKRLNTGDEATGTISTNLPTNATTNLYSHFWRNNGSTSANCAIDVFGFYMESEFWRGG